MNFKELFEAAKLVDPDDSIAVNVEAWRYCRKTYGPDDLNYHRDTLEWSVYSDKLRRHFKALTAREAYDKYVEAVKGPRPVNVAEEIEKVSI